MTTYHTLLGFCDWDLPAAIILLAVVALLIYNSRKLKKKETELQDLLDEKGHNSQSATDAARMAVPFDKNSEF